MGQLKLMATALAEIPAAKLAQVLMASANPLSEEASAADTQNLPKDGEVPTSELQSKPVQEAEPQVETQMDAPATEPEAVGSAQDTIESAPEYLSSSVVMECPLMPPVVETWVAFVAGKLTEVRQTDGLELAGFRR